MRLTYVATGALMTVRELMRNRLVLIMLFLIPSIFYTLVALTTTDRPIAFKLASVSEDTVVSVSQKSESLIFIGLAAVGFLTSFVAMNLIRRDVEVNRRLVICGYHSSELIVSKLTVLMGVILVVALFVSLSLLLFFRPDRFALTAVGLILAGWVYGAYGLLIGAIFRRELEAILFIVLLANIDAGWLQNPIYYADAQNTEIIRALPAYFPSQVSMVAAFSDHPVTIPVLVSIGYGLGLLVLAWIVHRSRMPAFRG
jgi:hypothetical protein